MATEKENPYLIKTADGAQITEAGRKYLERVVTDASGPVYAFTGGGSPLMAAAAMARLSRRGSDLREIYLDEFAFAGEEDAEELIDRVVTGYGDDSVQQLTSVLAVVEGASNLLTKIIEWSRLANYLEQSTRYIFFDKKDASGRYKYFTPSNLSPELTTQYNESLDRIFDLYSEIVRGVTEHVRTAQPEADPEKRSAWMGATRAQACDVARYVLPVGTKSTVGIVCSAQAMEAMIRRLFAHPLKEANDAGRMLLEQSRKVIGPFLKRADLPERGIAWAAYLQKTEETMKTIARSHPSLATESRDFSKEVSLLSFSPGNELDLVPNMLFKSTKLSDKERTEAVGALSFEDKELVFAAYMGERKNRRHKPGRAIEIAHYQFEFVGDYGAFRDLQRHRLVDDLDWQDLGIAYGYEVPKLIVEAGFESQFRECFAISESLYRAMMDGGFENEAQYAALLGHKLRYKFTINAREAFHLLELRTSPQGHSSYRKICLEMHRLLSEVHPRMGAAMIFVNKDGDPALSRMDAELATQLRLKLLDEKK